MSDASRGQQIRRNIRQEMESQLYKYCPNTFSVIAYRIAYDFNLTPDTVKYNYLIMFIANGILVRTEDGLLDLSARGKALQTTEDGLTDEDLQQELNEENENRSKLGKPRVSLEEWKKMRSRRQKPLEQ
jgi:hypothetical protein